MMKITINAFAKLNLSLDIKEKLPNGYHIIETVFQSVSLFDTINIKSGSQKNEVICDKGEINETDNICYKALIKFLEAAKIEDNCKISIIKRIPIAAGLAGGSADAAAVLRGLNQIYGFPISEKTLLSIGAELGADVPFCMIGGTMKADGIGENLTPLPQIPDCQIIIIKEGSKPSTAELYGKMDTIKDYPRPDIKSLMSALNENDIIETTKNIRNVFEEAWGDEIQKQKDLLISHGALCAELSGSGPSVFGIFKEREAQIVFDKLSHVFSKIYLCQPVSNGYEIVETE